MENHHLPRRLYHLLQVIFIFISFCAPTAQAASFQGSLKSQNLFQKVMDNDLEGAKKLLDEGANPEIFTSTRGHPQMK